MLALVNDFFDWLKEFSSDPTFYLIIFSIALLDAVLPVVPSETMVIIGGVAAGAGGSEDGKLFLPLVIAAGACGAFSGDNIAYLIGRSFSERIHRRYDRTERGGNAFNGPITRSNNAVACC